MCWRWHWEHVSCVVQSGDPVLTVYKTSDGSTLLGMLSSPASSSSSTTCLNTNPTGLDLSLLISSLLSDPDVCHWCSMSVCKSVINEVSGPRRLGPFSSRCSIWLAKSALLSPSPRLAATAVIDGEERRVNWTSHSGWRHGVVVRCRSRPYARDPWVIWLKWCCYTSGHPFFTVTVLRPSDQGHFPDGFLTTAYNHVRSSLFLSDILTSWVLIWVCVLYIGLQIFTLWQKSKVGGAYYIRWRIILEILR